MTPLKFSDWNGYLVFLNSLLKVVSDQTTNMNTVLN